MPVSYTHLDVYKRQKTGCGVGQASAGPFYCPTDKKIYLDMSFYKELTTKYKASGDFAMAYVIAHEVGHHVQNELGILGKYHRMQQGLSEKERNAISVRIELQADYLAGVWARSIQDRNLLDIGDIEEAMNAAHAVGDDTLQEQAYGYSVPDSFTHGTSEQRMRWFKRGYQYGDLQHGDKMCIRDRVSPEGIVKARASSLLAGLPSAITFAVAFTNSTN